MADQGGVSKITGSNIAPLSGQRAVDAAQPSGKRVGTGVASQGAGRREVPDAASRQWVNLDGKQFNRAAPRGTYLNILV